MLEFPFPEVEIERLVFISCLPPPLIFEGGVTSAWGVVAQAHATISNAGPMGATKLHGFILQF